MAGDEHKEDERGSTASSVAKGNNVEVNAMDEVQRVNLDREQFSKEIGVVAIKIPAKRTSELMKRLRKELLNIPKRKNVEACPGDASKRLLLLSTAVRDPSTLEGLTAEAAAFVREDPELETTTFKVKTGYMHLSVDEVLKQVLTPVLGDRELATSFETAGHVAHLNLRDHLLPYKKLIAQVVMDKNPRITTVVNKVGTISTEFRTFPMEVLAGDSNTKVELKESGCVFRFDFAKVYWNSRLQAEHARLIRLISESGKSPSEVVVCDMMAGVGPFSVPLARRGHPVFANDLNPESYEALRENGARNKCGRHLTTSNACGREFARGLIEKGQVFHHAILNLPNSALEFLDVFRGVDWGARGFPSPPTVHVYCFSKAEDPAQDALARANAVMGSDLTPADVKIHFVRDVAPKKPMLCLSFQAPGCRGEIAALGIPCGSSGAPAGTAGIHGSVAAEEGKGSAGLDGDSEGNSGGDQGSGIGEASVSCGGNESGGAGDGVDGGDCKRQRTVASNGAS